MEVPRLKVYTGKRRRVAAQMLAGKGFDQVINLSGGIKAWEDPTAFGTEDQGLDLYTRAANRSRDEQGRRALKRLAEEERTHLDRLAEGMDRL